MRYLLIALLLLAAVPAQSASLGELYRDVKDNTKVTMLDGISPAYFYNFNGPRDGNNKGGALNHVLTYRNLLTADIGWQNSLNGREVGAVVGGPGILLDNLVGELFPTYSQTIKAIAPEKLGKLLDAHFVSLVGGWKTTNGGFVYGISTGINLKW